MPISNRVRAASASTTWYQKAISEFCASSDGVALCTYLNGVSGKFNTSLEQYVQRELEAFWHPFGWSATTLASIGVPTLTNTGTATGRAFATTNLYSRKRKIGYDTSASSGQLCGTRVATSSDHLGTDGSFKGGFVRATRFGDPQTISGARKFTGVGAAGAPSNVEPSTLTNSIGVGYGASDTNMMVFYGGSAAQTPIDLGANFPANTAAVDWYELLLLGFAETDLKVGYQLKRLNTGDVTRGTLTGTVSGTQLPSATSYFARRSDWRTNNATASVIGIDFGLDYFANSSY